MVIAGGTAIAPLAIASTAAAANADVGAQARLLELEDIEAIRALHQRLVRQVNAGVLDGGSADMFVSSPRIELDENLRRLDVAAEGDGIEIDRAADGLSAQVRGQYLARTETRLEPNCAVAEMAIAQGNGFLRACEPKIIIIDLVKGDDFWKISKVKLT